MHGDKWTCTCERRETWTDSFFSRSMVIGMKERSFKVICTLYPRLRTVSSNSPSPFLQLSYTEEREEKLAHVRLSVKTPHRMRRRLLRETNIILKVRICHLVDQYSHRIFMISRELSHVFKSLVQFISFVCPSNWRADIRNFFQSDTIFFFS